MHTGISGLGMRLVCHVALSNLCSWVVEEDFLYVRLSCFGSDGDLPFLGCKGTCSTCIVHIKCVMIRTFFFAKL